WGLWARHDLEWGNWAVATLTSWIGDTSELFAVLIYLGIGLRAAVAISSERERGTWDGLLTSPLDGGEIVRGKLFGSLHALWPLLLAAVWAWSLAFAFGAMSGTDY